uniref:Fibrinogen C-terminal domain-containing protein n=1 Tax=Parastrongyloides trichosuri TaxID=131310 RepID=A0A0N4Z8K1_PARTI
LILRSLDCSPTNRERELGLDRRETGYVYFGNNWPQNSTRGTAGSANWYMTLLETVMRRSYQLQNYD